MATSEQQALQLLRDSGAPSIDHPGGDLFSHLVRTYKLLQEWSASEAVCLAGLCHAVYGTDGFRRSLLPVAERSVVRAAVGPAAEAIVYRYGACDRALTLPRLGPATVTFSDRFTGEVEDVTGDDLEAFAVLTMANELDIARALSPAPVEDIVRLIEVLAIYAPGVAGMALRELRD
jgi:hypothetical protein